MHAKLIQPGITNVTPLWYCILGSQPSGYNCVPGGGSPKNANCIIGIAPAG
ncbi:MAG: hypothetical protein HXS48_27510 [Theionarchaea archaeon]|nr:hypothetical protein [Theionarchaea archaeon]